MAQLQHLGQELTLVQPLAVLAQDGRLNRLLCLQLKTVAYSLRAFLVQLENCSPQRRDPVRKMP